MKSAKLIAALVSATTLSLLTVSTAQAGGPLANCADGVPFLWPNGGANVEINLDQGALGALSNAEADAFILAALQTWTDIDTATISYLQGVDIPADIDETNFGPIFSPTAPNGQSEVVYDADGAIFTAVFGANSGILGFAGPDFGDPATCELLEGSAFLNGPEFLAGDPENFGAGIIFHEFGHFNNLAHTQTNGAILLGDSTGPSPNDSFGVPSIEIFRDTAAGVPTDALDTMYPFIFVGPDLGSSTPALSDTTSISALYPAPGYRANSATISGAVLAPDGVTRISGVNVIARNVNDPFEDAVSTLSGDRTDDFDPATSPFVGTYEFTGLTPGATYQIYIDEIVDGGFSTPPQQPLLGPEEFYSGAAESNDDDPTLVADVVVTAGSTSTGVDIIINTPQPGDPLPTGPFGDGSVELMLPFPFDFCGVRHNSVFVNGNGNVTFGAPSGSFTESAGEHLGDLPRIAGLWNDLNSSAGGILTFDTDGASFFKIIWNEVPEFPAEGANTFSITLKAKYYGAHSTRFGNPFVLRYGDVTSQEGLSGYSCGGSLTTSLETESNLSRKRVLWGGAAVYEQWTNSGQDNEVFDLAGKRRLSFGVGRFNDPFESRHYGWGHGSDSNNNSIENATRIGLPFDSERRFTAIDPIGDDVDYYRFHVKAGDIVAMEVVRGQLDSLIGVFDRDSGTLLALDDDGGDGLLSRLVLQFNEDVNIALAVTTFPDGGFTGAGGSGGRYVLSVRKYRGDVFFLGDDDAVEIPLPDSFDFRGAEYDSVFINSNGSLTFGEGDTDFSESVEEFLAGPPRIATLWDDLDPSGFFGNPGFYVVDYGDESATIHGISIGEFFSSSPNYFSVKLDDDGEVKMTYGATARSDALVGLTEGGGAADPGPTNLSRGHGDELESNGTVYENFPAFPTKTTPFSDFDLLWDKVKFEEDD